MSDDLAVYEMIAAAIADAHEPDLSPFDPAQVRTAMERVLGTPEARRDFLAWLDTRVRQLSEGRVSLEERPTDEPPPGDQPGQPDRPEPRPAPALDIRLVVVGEPFAEPAVVQAGDPVVQFPMRV